MSGTGTCQVHPSSLRSKSAGVTLLELMVVLAAMAILTAIALPAYRDYVLRGHLASATEGLTAMRARMEKHFQNRRTYETSGGDTTPCQDTTVSNRTFGVFVVDCASVSATAFQLRATGSAPAAGFVFTLDERDQRATTSAASGWATCASRWLTRKGDTC